MSSTKRRSNPSSGDQVIIVMSLLRGHHVYRTLEEDDKVLQYHEHIKTKKRCCSSQKIVPLIILGFAVIFVTVMAIAMSTSENTENPSREISTQTTCGKVFGRSEDGAIVFKGIPYALPPVGSLRWKPPISLNKQRGCWKEPLKAYKFGSKCIQDIPDKGIYEGSEDCLYLNIWTPILDSKASLPVIVYLHGGFLHWGSGNEETLSPTANLAHKLNVVFVSLNYRLFTHGFLALDLLSKNSTNGKSGNYGLKDQILALKWVQENIKHFGGNPLKVTLFGHSSGATCVFALLASPSAKGLFHRAWLSSPSPQLDQGVEDASEYNKIFLQRSNCSSLQCLYNLQSQDVLHGLPPSWGAEHKLDLPVKGEFDHPLLLVDNDTLPLSPIEAWLQGVVNDVPLLIGSTAQEIDIKPPTKEIIDWNWLQYESYLKRKLDTFDHNITRIAMWLYNNSNTVNGDNPNPHLSFVTMTSDVRAVCPTNSLADVATKYFQSPVYRYVITMRPSKPIQLPFSYFSTSYAFHMLDIIAFFSQLKNYISHPTTQDLAFEQQMQTNVMDFVRMGMMRQFGWQEYPAVAEINNTITMKSFYHKGECDFWENNDFWDYAWIN